MGLIRKLRGITPKIGEKCFLAETSAIIGDVEIGEECSVWYGAVLRGDVNPIRIGNRVNVQDNAVLHTLYQKSVCIIEDDVSIGHNAVIHGATIKKGCLIGMSSVVMDNAVVGEGSIVAAGSVVLSNTIIEPHSLYAGVPAKFVKKLEEKHTESNLKLANNYVFYSKWYKEEE
ncbi:MAG TPA: gamma carbonic anhydrase family protein [Porphyromonadaceae bacterium]|nr:gamma carbonic anhydrase family protein [Porphyromonadaceae bacterium]